MLYKANPEGGAPAPLEGQPHPEDTARAVDAIRELICREEGLTPAPRTPSAPAPQEQVQVQESKRARRSTRRRTKAQKKPQPRPARRKTSVPFQPDWRISGAILLLAVVLWRPWLLPTLFVLFSASCAIIYFTLGPDRVSELVVRWHARMQRRNPKRAERVRAWGNRMSARLERWASRLPDRWVDGLYFPVFEATAEDGAPNDPFVRLLPQERL